MIEYNRINNLKQINALAVDKAKHKTELFPLYNSNASQWSNFYLKFTLRNITYQVKKQVLFIG
jgi:transposase